jgi:hypothetical protein
MSPDNGSTVDEVERCADESMYIARPAVRIWCRFAIRRSIQQAPEKVPDKTKAQAKTPTLQRRINRLGAM